MERSQPTLVLGFHIRTLLDEESSEIKMTLF
jgi:hypothetical protein